MTAYSIREAGPLEFETFKLGREGWPVIACQIALNSHYAKPVLVLDGIFGSGTQKAVKEVQAALGITQDGVAGPETQTAFTKAKCRHAELNATPPGLLAGICDIESSYSWPCVSTLNSNGTHDYGVTQESLAQPSEAELLYAFNPDASAHRLAGETAGAYKVFVGKVGPRRAWELAALNHNWPSAAFALADGETWINTYKAKWLEEKGYATGLAYANHYIEVATRQVTAWTVNK